MTNTFDNKCKLLFLYLWTIYLQFYFNGVKWVSDSFLQTLLRYGWDMDICFQYFFSNCFFHSFLKCVFVLHRGQIDDEIICVFNSFKEGNVCKGMLNIDLLYVWLNWIKTLVKYVSWKKDIHMKLGICVYLFYMYSVWLSS